MEASKIMQQHFLLSGQFKHHSAANNDIIDAISAPTVLSGPIEIPLSIRDQTGDRICSARSVKIVQYGLCPIVVDYKYSSATKVALSATVIEVYIASELRGTIQVADFIHEQSGRGPRAIRGIPGEAIK